MTCSVKAGEALKIVSELQELSQNALSKLTGISQSNISALENNTTHICIGRVILERIKTQANNPKKERSK